MGAGKIPSRTEDVRPSVCPSVCLLKVRYKSHPYVRPSVCLNHDRDRTGLAMKMKFSRNIYHIKDLFGIENVQYRFKSYGWVFKIRPSRI